jgi:PKHD-type hydroxylase
MSWPRQMVFDSAFDREHVAEINCLVADLPMSTRDQTVQDARVRYAEARWLRPGRATQWIRDLLGDIFHVANREFGYAIEGFREPLLHVTYPVGGHFSWHTDTAYGPMATRKLSVSVLLCEPASFDGGRLEFCPGGALRNGHAMGTAVVFPSYMAHRITPVTRGQRVALVAWMHGSEFR